MNTANVAERGTATWISSEECWAKKYGAKARINFVETRNYNGADGSIAVLIGKYYTFNAADTMTIGICSDTRTRISKQDCQTEHLWFSRGQGDSSEHVI